MTKFLVGFFLGVKVAIISVLVIQWFGIENARDVMAKRLYDTCEKTMLRRTKCLQKHPQKQCVELVSDVCGVDPSITDNE